MSNIVNGDVDYSFLGSLPPELRNQIYELVFASDSPHIGEIPIFDAAPPRDRSLLLTCRQVYAEASEIYRSACRRYWTETIFSIQLNCPFERELGPLCRRINELAIEPEALAMMPLMKITAIDRLEGMTTSVHKKLEQGTNKSDLTQMMKDFCEAYHILLHRQFYEEIVCGL